MYGVRLQPQANTTNTYRLSATLAASDTTPPTISSATASGITSSGATITWTTNEASDTQVNYGMTTSLGTFTTLNSSLVTSHSVTLSGLSANTTYYYQARSKDAAGNLGTSSTYSFTTSSAGTGDPTEPAGGNDTLATASQVSVPVSVTAYIYTSTDIDYYKFTPTSSGTLTIQMTVPASKDFDVYLQDANGANTGYQGTAGTGVTENFTAPVTANTTYYLKVYGYSSAYDTTNTYRLSATLAASDTTPPTISSATASGITSSGATITWTTTEASDTQVNYGMTTSLGTFTTLNSSLVTSHSVTLSGLSANTTYYYQARSNDAAGNLGTGPVQQFTTTNISNPTLTAVNPTFNLGAKFNIDYAGLTGVTKVELFADTYKVKEYIDFTAPPAQVIWRPWVHLQYPGYPRPSWPSPSGDWMQNEPESFGSHGLYAVVTSSSGVFQTASVTVTQEPYLVKPVSPATIGTFFDESRDYGKSDDYLGAVCQDYTGTPCHRCEDDTDLPCLTGVDTVLIMPPDPRAYDQHTGIDFFADGGTPILAPQAGTTGDYVEYSYNSELNPVQFNNNPVTCGNSLALTHGQADDSMPGETHSYKTVYCHTTYQSQAVASGTPVSRGTKIAEVGNTGWSYGNHLHITTYDNDTLIDIYLRGLIDRY